jgi:hypothetical protein
MYIDKIKPRLNPVFGLSGDLEVPFDRSKDFDGRAGDFHVPETGPKEGFESPWPRGYEAGEKGAIGFPITR